MSSGDNTFMPCVKKVKQRWTILLLTFPWAKLVINWSDASWSIIQECITQCNETWSNHTMWMKHYISSILTGIDDTIQWGLKQSYYAEEIWYISYYNWSNLYILHIHSFYIFVFFHISSKYFKTGIKSNSCWHEPYTGT